MLKSTLIIFPIEFNKLRQPKTRRVLNWIKRMRIQFLINLSFPSKICSKIFFNQFSQIILIFSKYFLKTIWRIWLCGCRCKVLVWNHIIGGTGLIGYWDRSDRLGCTGLIRLINQFDWSLPVLSSLYISVKHLICDRTDRCHSTSEVQVVDYAHKYSMEVQHWQANLFSECWPN